MYIYGTHTHIMNANGNRRFGVLVFQSVHAVELLVNIYSCRFSKKKRERARGLNWEETDEILLVFSTHSQRAGSTKGRP